MRPSWAAHGSRKSPVHAWVADRKPMRWRRAGGTHMRVRGQAGVDAVGGRARGSSHRWQRGWLLQNIKTIIDDAESFNFDAL